MQKQNEKKIKHVVRADKKKKKREWQAEWAIESKVEVPDTDSTYP